jgi:hypothetical protein
MARRATRGKRQELNWNGIAMVIGVLAAAYLLYTFLLPLLIVSFVALIIVVIIAVIGAYFILPKLGITGLAALLNIKK